VQRKLRTILSACQENRYSTAALCVSVVAFLVLLGPLKIPPNELATGLTIGVWQFAMTEAFRRSV
jgi:hypothetical protein